MTVRCMILMLLLITISACSSGGGVRALSEKEMEIMGKTHAQLKANQAYVVGSLDDLSDNLGTALADQHSLSLSISKAKLLESMKSPWSITNPDLAATQKEVALYHLYALSEAEQGALDARIAEREQAIAEVKKAYGLLVSSMAGLIASQKLILSHLNQPANAQISAFVGNVLAESKALRETLSASDNPRLKELSAELAVAEGQVEKATENINKALKAISEYKGNGK